MTALALAFQSTSTATTGQSVNSRLVELNLTRELEVPNMQRIIRLRQAIRSGLYDSGHRLDIAFDRMIDTAQRAC